MNMLRRAVVGVVGLTSIALAQPPNPTLQKLWAIGKRAQKPVAAGTTCVVPGRSEAATLKKVALAWIDQQFPAEHGEKSDVSDTELVFDAGCKDTHATYVSIGQDRKLKAGDSATRRNFILKIAGDTVEQVAARTSTYSMNWMEWADEGGYSIVAMADLDGDGSNDLVWSDNEHEGGATSTSANLSVRFANGKSSPIGRVRNLVDVRVVTSQLVMAGQVRYDQRPVYACIGKDLRLSLCPAMAAAQRASDKLDAASQLANLSELPDRDLAAGWLAKLGVKAPDELSALPATTPVVKAQRHVEAFLATKQLDQPFAQVFEQPHLEAEAYFAQLATRLGDQSCTPAPLTDAARARLTAWVAKQDKQGAEGIELEPECGTYAWAAWNRKGDRDRTESLVGLEGSEPVRVATFPVEYEQGGRIDHYQSSEFFQHGDTVIGVVIRNDNLAVIANDKIVAQSHGSIHHYDYDSRWTEHSFDLIVDSGTIMHPTPTGIEKLDRTLIKDRETERLAIERLVFDPPSHEPAYLVALRTVGADAKLIAECKAL